MPLILSLKPTATGFCNNNLNGQTPSTLLSVVVIDFYHKRKQQMEIRNKLFITVYLKGSP